MKRVSVIIPTFSRWNEAKKCLDSLVNDDCSCKTVLLVNDGSTDGTEAACTESFPEVEIVNGDGNLWWSGGINLGLNLALEKNADCIIWINDDNLDWKLRTSSK